MVRTIVLAVALLAFGACHRTTYTTTRPRGETKSVWTHYYVLGLIGHAKIDAKKLCPNGVARIVGYQNVGHILLTVVTIGIYAPRMIAVTCAVHRGPPGASPPDAPSPGGSQ